MSNTSLDTSDSFLAPVKEGVAAFTELASRWGEEINAKLAENEIYLSLLDGVSPLAFQLGVSEAQLMAWATLLALIVVVSSVFVLIRHRKTIPVGASLSSLTRRARWTGVIAALMFVGGFVGWSVIAPLASASLAEGVVSPDGSRKTLTHLEGGIINEIHIREGQAVEKGQPLITLENIAAKAKRDELQKRLLYLIAVEARLEAERKGQSAIEFPNELFLYDQEETALIAEAQLQHFDTRRFALLGREKILEQRILQFDEQNKGIRKIIEAQHTQIALIEEETENVQGLYEAGLANYPRLLALKREAAELKAERAAHEARILENSQKIGETQYQLISIREEFAESVSEELVNVQSNLAQVRSILPSRQDVLERTVLRAPISGTVMEINATTVSGVIRAGEEILDIVPMEAPLIIDARVKPSDIDRVFPGMSARVILSAYKQRNLPLIYGTLRTISADRIVEDRTGDAYFLAKIEIDTAMLDELGDIRMMPGMPAEIMLVNAERTILDYLLSPIMDSLRKSFKEA